jgi:acetyl esterase
MSAPVPHAQVQAYLNSLQEPFPSRDLDIAEQRRAHQNLSLAVGGTPEAVESIEDLRIGPFQVRIYRPRDADRSALVWIHGGGWFAGDLISADRVARAIASRSDSTVVSVDYRLAPEDPFPAGLEDCWAATTWASTRFTRVAVGGDSAGGNLAAAVALRARDKGIKLALQLLVYPVLHAATDSDAYREFVNRYELFAGMEGFGARYQQGIAWLWNHYVPDASQRTLPDASPLCVDSVRGVAPALIIVGEHDILRAESEAYAHRLREEGVPVELQIFKGQIHGFFQMLGVMDDADRAVRVAGVALKAAFESSQQPLSGSRREQEGS